MKNKTLAGLLGAFLYAALAAAQPAPVGIPDGPNAALPGKPLNQDRAKFSVSAFDDTAGNHWFYYSSQNSRVLMNIQRPNGTWMYNPSRVAIQFLDNGQVGQGTGGVATVMKSPASPYFNARDGHSYSYIMYTGYQRPNDPSAGSACVAFSNDGLTWTQAITLVTDPSHPWHDCGSGGEVALESYAAFHRTGSEIHLFGLSGDLAALTANDGVGPSLTYFYKAQVSSPHVLQLVGQVNSGGLYTPNMSGGRKDNFFRNLDVTYDPMSGKLFVFRVTPYPYKPNTGTDPTQWVPCSGVCPHTLATFPMRGQIYYMQTDGATWKATSTIPWTLLADGGGSTGWSTTTSGSCAPFPLVDSMVQRAIGYDLDSLSIKKNSDGTLYRNSLNQMVTYFGGWTNRQQSCNTRPDAPSTFLDGSLYTVAVGLP